MNEYTGYYPNNEPLPPNDEIGPYYESGSSGLQSWGGYVRMAHNPLLFWPGCRTLYFRIWRADPEVTIARNFFDSLASRLTLGWQLPEHSRRAQQTPPTDDDKRALEFAYSLLDDTDDNGFSEWLQQALQRVPFFGWGWWEVPLGVRSPQWNAPNGDQWRSQYNDGLIGIRRLAFRDEWSFYRWDMDDFTKRLTGMYQLDTPNPVVYMPLDSSLHVTFGDHNNPEGLATLEPMWRLERYKYNLEVVQGIGFEHTAGYLKFSTETNLDNNDKAIIKTAARSVMTAQEGNYMMLPDKISADLVDTNFAAAPSILQAIQHYSTLKLALLGMQFIALGGTGGGSTSYAAMDDSSGLAITMFNSIADGFVKQADQQLGRRIFDNPVNRAAFPNMTRRPRLYIESGVNKKTTLGELGQFVSQVGEYLKLDDNDINAIRQASGVLPSIEVEKTQEGATETGNGKTGQEPDKRVFVSVPAKVTQAATGKVTVGGLQPPDGAWNMETVSERSEGNRDMMQALLSKLSDAVELSKAKNGHKTHHV